MPCCISHVPAKCRSPLEPDSSQRISQEIRAARVGRYRPLAFAAVGAACPDDQKGGRRLPSVPSHAPNAPQRRHGSPLPRKVERHDNVKNSRKTDGSISSRRKSARLFLSESCHHPLPRRSPLCGPLFLGNLGVVGSHGGAVAPSERQRALFRVTGSARAKNGCGKTSPGRPCAMRAKGDDFSVDSFSHRETKVFDVQSLADAVVNVSPAPTLLALTWGSADWGGGAQTQDTGTVRRWGG